MAVIIKIDATVEQRKDMTLLEMQDIVGGNIESLTLPNGRVMIVNEEGKLFGLEQNLLATVMVKDCGINDWIAGDAILFKAGELK